MFQTNYDSTVFDNFLYLSLEILISLLMFFTSFKILARIFHPMMKNPSRLTINLLIQIFYSPKIRSLYIDLTVGTFPFNRSKSPLSRLFSSAIFSSLVIASKSGPSAAYIGADNRFSEVLTFLSKV